jgi:hypothetical protein
MIRRKSAKTSADETSDGETSGDETESGGIRISQNRTLAKLEAATQSKANRSRANQSQANQSQERGRTRSCFFAFASRKRCGRSALSLSARKLMSSRLAREVLPEKPDEARRLREAYST